MNNYFQKNLKLLTEKYSQKEIALSTGFSKSSISNYLKKDSEPSIQFLMALKESYGINVDEFLFKELYINEEKSYDRFIGNYLLYYYNNDSYKGEVHSNLKNTLNFGVISIYKEKVLDKNIKVLATFSKDRSEAIKFLKKLNQSKIEDIEKCFHNLSDVYIGHFDYNEQNIFIALDSAKYKDKTFIILNNPPTSANYIGGVGSVNSISRGREHNPCSQFILLSKKVLDITDGEVYNLLKFDRYTIDLSDETDELVALFKKLYLSEYGNSNLDEEQKISIVKNKIEFMMRDVFEANAFRFAKISNKDDDSVYRIIKEGIDVWKNR